MLPLAKRKEVRAHNRAVATGEIVDPVVTFGTDDKGNVIGNDGKPVEGTAPKGFTVAPTEPAAPVAFDYTTLATHADLDGEKGLNGREAPEGWAGMKVVEKQTWLDANRPAPAAPVNGW